MARRISKSYLCAVKCMYALVKFLDEENRECSLHLLGVGAHGQHHPMATHHPQHGLSLSAGWSSHSKGGSLSDHPKGTRGPGTWRRGHAARSRCHHPHLSFIEGNHESKKDAILVRGRIFFMFFMLNNYYKQTIVIC